MYILPPLTCHYFAELCITYDNPLWYFRCIRLWCGKCEASVARFRDCQHQTNYQCRYLQSVVDSKRTRITEQELCSLVWALRFKEGVGEDMLRLDPYWEHASYSELGKLVWTQETVTSIILRKFHMDGRFTVQPGTSDSLHIWAQQMQIPIRWRLTKSREGKRGHFLKLNQWPSSRSQRNPCNWGWIFYNEWTVTIYPPTKEHFFALHNKLEKCETWDDSIPFDEEK